MDTIEQRESQESAAVVEQRARALIEAHHNFAGRARHFEFQYEEGVLTVRGNVPSYYLKQMLQIALKDVQGVDLIDNQVTVISSEWHGGNHETAGR